MRLSLPSPPEGDFWARLDGGDLYVERADSCILISDRVIEQFRTGSGLYCHPAVSLVGDVLTIRAANRTVIYRLGEHIPEWHAYVAEWPD